jgi:threonine synthase
VGKSKPPFHTINYPCSLPYTILTCAALYFSSSSPPHFSLLLCKDRSPNPRSLPRQLPVLRPRLSTSSSPLSRPTSIEHLRNPRRRRPHRIQAIAVKTPLVRAQFPGLSGHGQPREIYLKAESLQPIGAFKIRGAANKILQLTPEEIARGVITYSSGNHAQGVAYAAREVGAKAVIVMPSNAPAIKRAATLAMGAEIVDVGPASSDRLAKSDELVRQHGYVVIPPYDDEQIIAGQATCGLEIIEALPETSTWSSPPSPAAACSPASPQPSSS